VGQVTDGDAFAQFMSARYPALVRTADLLVGDRGRAEDLVQSALYRTLRAWPRLRAPEAAESYTRTTMVRLAGKWRRRRWTGELPAADPTPGQVTGAGGTVPSWREPDATVDTARALAALTPQQRAVLVLRYFDDLSEARTAEVLGCSVGTVKSRASRALAALRAEGLLGSYAADAAADEEVRYG
jgi:RNA polymerase sigma-70 factor (sigma-E family)